MTREQAEVDYKAAVKKTAEIFNRMKLVGEGQDQPAHEKELSQAAKELSQAYETRNLYSEVIVAHEELKNAVQYQAAILGQIPDYCYNHPEVDYMSSFNEAHGRVSAAAERLWIALKALPQD